MNVNENKFFRNITPKICGSLDLGTAFQSSFDVLKKFMPLDMMSLHLYDARLGTLHTVHETNEVNSRDRDVVTTLDKTGRASFTESGVPDIRIVNDPKADAVISRVLKSLKLKEEMSALVMRLIIENQRIGSLVLFAEGYGRYTPTHARLFALLNEPYAIAVANALTHQEAVRLKDMITEENSYLRKELVCQLANEIIGGELGLRHVMDMVRKVAPLESPVLLLGETGVGKGVFASAVHELSLRSRGPFITVNSGAIPETLVDSELFGHEKGAFTGAVEQKRGRFERAEGGTIFLDEIGELPLQAQVRLLRVLQDRVIERVGGSKSIPVDIRIIAATHRNLNEMVQTGHFREDLLFRINVFPIKIPALRERKTDIPAFVFHFIQKKARELKLPYLPELTPSAVNRLVEYDWPGNVRELENVVEREIILNRKGPLTFDHLSNYKLRGHETASIEDAESQALTLDEICIRHIERVLRKVKGKIHGEGGAAKILGINPSTLRSRMDKLGIRYKK